MSISVNNAYGNYASHHSAALAQKTQAKQAAHAANENTAQADTVSYSSMYEYSKALQEKYGYFNTSTSVQGIPTTVSVSASYLQKCMNDPEQAKKLEDNLKAIPNCVSTAVSGCLGTITNLSYKIDADGNMSVAISGTSDPDGKTAKENAARKAEEAKRTEEKADEKKSKENEEASRKKGMVGINAAKLARKLAAAKTRSQVRAVIAEIQQDLRECEAGKMQGMDVDEASVQAAKSVLGMAKQRLGQAESREATPEEEIAFALAGLM